MTEPTPQRTRLLASGLLVAMFVLGALVGAAFDRLLTAQQSEVVQPVAVRDTVPREDRRERERNRPRSMLLDPKVIEELGTTAEQQQKIHELLEKRDQENRRIFNKIKPELDANMEGTRREIRAQLTPEQVKKLDQLIAERRERWRQRNQNNQGSKTPADSQKSDHPREPDFI